MLKSLAIFLLIAVTAIPAFAAELLVPNANLTPGAINSEATKELICVKGYTSGNDAHGVSVRNVSEITKKKVFAEYGIDSKTDKFEIDHLISLELGGSNDIKNLWPESYTTTPLNARVKDGLENRLHALVCSGKISLSDAQAQISKNWIDTYVKYVGPLPKQ